MKKLKMISQYQVLREDDAYVSLSAQLGMTSLWNELGLDFIYIY